MRKRTAPDSVKRFAVYGSLAGLLFCSECVFGFDLSDPFRNENSVAAPAAEAATRDCNLPASLESLSLGQIVDRALCNNPQTRVAWENARAAAFQVGVSQSAYLPTLTANGSITRNTTTSGVVGINRVGAAGNSTTFDSRSYGVSLSYLLYDFGARSAALDNSRALLAAANATRDSVIQSVFLAAVQAYYQLLAAQALVESTGAAERSALEAFKAAEAKYQAGTATPADKLQAKTAYSQAVLTRIRAEGDYRNAKGALMNAIGVDANSPFTLATPQVAVADEKFTGDVAALIAVARRQRPDLAAAAAQVEAAQASVEGAKSAGMPTVSLSAGSNFSGSTFTSTSRNDSLGLSVSIPLFSGFSTTYRVNSAQAAVDAKLATQQQIRQQVALDVWKAYQNLNTESDALRQSRDLLDSATAAEKMANGRYRAGAGTILDLLTAQSALAGARQQNVQALYNWRIARATLAQAMGRIDFRVLNDTQYAAGTK